MIQKIVKIEETVKYKVDVSTSEGSAMYGATAPPPIANLTLGGWKYTTTGLTDKFEYTFKSNEPLAPLLLRNLRYFYMIVTCENVAATIDVPFLRLKTEPQGGGTDPDPTYHSQIDYSLNPTKYQFFNTDKCVLWAGNQHNEPDIFPNLRKIRLDDVLIDGDGDGDETLNTLGALSLAGVAASKSTTVFNLGWEDNRGGFQNIKLVG